MKMRKRALTAFVAGMSFLTLTACHRTDRWHCSDADHLDRANRYISWKLKLDEQQQRQLAALLNTVGAHRRALLTDQNLFEIFALELSKEKMDAVKLQRMTADEIRKMENAAGLWVAQLAAFHQTLSSDQKQRLDRLIENRRRHAGRYFCNDK